MLFIRRPPHGGFPWGTRQNWMLTADKRIIIRISWIVRGITRSSSTFYNIGTYWVAFERSAFRVDNIFQGCEISLFIVPGYPEYVVMASVYMMMLMIISGNVLFITTNLIIRFCLFLRLL